MREDSGGLADDGVLETVKNKIKKSKGSFFGAWLAPLAASVAQPVIPSIEKRVSGRELKEQEEVTWIKNFSYAPSIKVYSTLITNLGLMLLFQEIKMELM